MCYLPDRRSFLRRSIYHSATSRESLFALYDRMLDNWPVPLRVAHVQTSFGLTHVLCCGPQAAPPLVLLHPGRSNSVLWMRNVEQLSRHYRVYAVDIIGDAGKSEPDAALPFGFDRPWLLQVLDSLFVDRVDLVAISGASRLAINVASYVPNRIRRLVLVSASLDGLAANAQMRSRALRARLIPSDANLKSLFTLLAPTLDSGDVMLDYQHSVYRSAREPRYPVYQAGRFEASPPFAPILLLLGEREAAFDPVAAANVGRRIFPNVTVDFLPEVGHLMHIERPDLVDSRITTYLSS
jgi:pimeloyl-ACP methyl ester carboxylesterase